MNLSGESSSRPSGPKRAILKRIKDYILVCKANCLVSIVNKTIQQVG
jgi:hypothetical protein